MHQDGATLCGRGGDFYRSPAQRVCQGPKMFHFLAINIASEWRFPLRLKATKLTPTVEFSDTRVCGEKSPANGDERFRGTHRERKNRPELFWAQTFLNTPRGPGHPGKIPEHPRFISSKPKEPSPPFPSSYLRREVGSLKQFCGVAGCFWVGLFYLRLSLFYLRLVCVACGCNSDLWSVTPTACNSDFWA